MVVIHSGSGQPTHEEMIRGTDLEVFPFLSYPIATDQQVTKGREVGEIDGKLFEQRPTRGRSPCARRAAHHDHQKRWAMGFRLQLGQPEGNDHRVLDWGHRTPPVGGGCRGAA